MWPPVCSQAVDWVAWLLCGFGPGLCGLSAALCLCAGQPATEPGVHPPEVSGVWAQPGFQVWAPSPLIWVRASRASGESWGCLSCVHSPGAEGGGVPEAAAASEGSLTSHCVPVFSLFLFEKFFLFKPPWSKQAPGLSYSATWLSPKNPVADPAPGPGLQPPWSPGRSQGPYCP